MRGERLHDSDYDYVLGLEEQLKARDSITMQRRIVLSNNEHGRIPYLTADTSLQKLMTYNDMTNNYYCRSDRRA